MSCNCSPADLANPLFACPCDSFVFPKPLDITAGLTDLPRQIGIFPEFRQSLLYSIRSKTALATWLSRKPDDLGLMMLEMWSYLCDSLSFYDKVIADEQYIATANQRASIRKLVALLGYLPAPAVGATATLAALADGVKPVSLSAGTSFRSAAFNGNPPQVFQLTNDTTIDPFANKWRIRPDHPLNITSGTGSFFLVQPQVSIKAGTLLLLVDTGDYSQNQVLTCSGSSPYTGVDGTAYTKINFSGPWTLRNPTAIGQLSLMISTRSAMIESFPVSSPQSYQTLVLDKVYRQIKSGDFVVVDGQASPIAGSGSGSFEIIEFLLFSARESRWFTVSSVSETTYSGASASIVINSSTFSISGAAIPATSIYLDKDLNDPSRKVYGNWTDPSVSQLIFYYGFQSIGKITNEPDTTLAFGDPMFFTKPAPALSEKIPPSSFLLQDCRLNGHALEGSVDFSTPGLNPGQGTGFTPPMIHPVDVYGNAINVNRGETVPSEILGSGNGALINQAFKLKKNPLTYLPSPGSLNNNASRSTLVIRVDGIKWTEVSGFYGKTGKDNVYILRQNDNQETIVTFGDGVRGARLPTGINNIIATYQFGAGAAEPPAGTITQIVNPVKGLKTVKNILDAAGGADADTGDEIRTFGPKSVLILGRIVSIDDMVAVALAYPGVDAVQAEWRWRHTAQQPMVHIWYIGEAGLEAGLSARIHDVTDPTTPVFIDNATGNPSNLQLDVEVDSNYDETLVLPVLRQTLIQGNGLLVPANVGIGQPLFRSRLFEEILSVAGIISVKGINWDGTIFSEYSRTSMPGTYYDFISGTLLLNGNAS